MNIKTSFFNPTVLKKDLTRFLPLWTIYLILGLLLTVSNMGGSLYYYNAKELAGSLQWLSVGLCVYALLASQLLFGDLFQSRMCNAVHALPVRREGLFVTHFTAGLLMGIGPNVIISLVSMMTLKSLWFVALLWLGAMSMMYLLFFGIAVFCMICSGNRFAGVALYALVNLLGVIIMWLFQVFYLPMLYGIEMTGAMRNIFYNFSPVVKLADASDWLTIQHATNCPIPHYSNVWIDQNLCRYRLTAYGDIWGYLGIATVFGAAFGAAALVLYRRRQLESAGDFLSFKSAGVLFTLAASACVGGLCYYIAAETYIGMVVGLVVGFFVCRMLLDRTVKVFHKKSWLQLTAFCLAVALSFGLTYFDVLGVARRVPDAENVKSVTIADGYLSEYRLEDINLDQPEAGIVPVMADPFYTFSKEGMVTLTEAEDIQKICQIHGLLIDEGDARQNGNRNYQTVTVHYQLKNGTTMTRYYNTALDSKAMQQLRAYTQTPEYILGYASVEEMCKYLHFVQIYGFTDGSTTGEITDDTWMQKLAEALFADVQAGNWLQNTENKETYVMELYLEYQLEGGYYGSQYLTVPQTATHTLACVEAYAVWYKENNQTAA